jgi:hypothetical protein
MTSRFQLSPALELERIVPLELVIELTTLSRDTIKRCHKDKLIQLSPRRLGMRLRDALMLKEDRQ